MSSEHELYLNGVLTSGSTEKRQCIDEWVEGVVEITNLVSWRDQGWVGLDTGCRLGWWGYRGYGVHKVSVGCGELGVLPVAGRSSLRHQWPTQHNVILVHYPCKLLSVHNNKSFTSKITIFDPYTGLPVTWGWGWGNQSPGAGGWGKRDCKQTTLQWLNGLRQEQTRWLHQYFIMSSRSLYGLRRAAQGEEHLPARL